MKSTRKHGIFYGLFAALMLLIPALMMSGCPSGGGGGGGDDGGGGGSKLSGQMIVPQRVILDYDTNDPNNPPASNDTQGLAQPGENLTFVAGFASSATPDYDDYFSVDLKAGDQINLMIADETSAALDLDLYLADLAGNTLDSSTSSTADIETVTVPADGTYLVRVSAFAAGSIYTLALGATTSTSADFVIGEAIVKFKTGDAAMQAASLGLGIKEVDPYGTTLVRFDDEPAVKSLAGRFGLPAGDQTESAKRATLTQIARLKARPDVAYAEPNYIMKPLLTPNDPYFSRMWDLEAINARFAWDTTTGNSNVVIAIVDTGVLYNHPDLAANILKDGANVVGYDLILDPPTAGDGNGRDPDPYDVGDRVGSPFSSFHGTHCAGTAAAATNNSLGVAGVAWGVKIMPVRVLGKNGGTLMDVAEGILYAAGLDNASGAKPMIGATLTPAHIISLSLGGPSNTATLQNAITLARNAGSIIIAAAGNDNTSAPSYPAAHDGVVGVSATDYAGNKAPYSNYGSYVDIAAPGGNTSADLNGDGYYDGILSTLGNDSGCSGSYNPKTCIAMTYDMYQGTSMAAPHMAGVVALMISAFDDLAPGRDFTPLDLDNLIQGLAGNSVPSITNQAKGVRNNNLGYGLIDAEKAVEAARVLAGTPVDTSPRLSLLPHDLAFGFSANRLEALIVNRGVDPLGGLTVLDYDTSFGLSHILSTSGNTLIVDANRAGLTDGAYSTAITVSSQFGGTDSVNVTVLSGSFVGSNVGIVYILLVNPNTLQTMYQTVTGYDQGYQYSFGKIAPGFYYLAAGTDLDNDFYLGDNGELFGLYPSINAPQKLDATDGKNLTGIDVPLQFIGLPLAASALSSSGGGTTFRRLP